MDFFPVVVVEDSICLLPISNVKPVRSAFHHLQVLTSKQAFNMLENINKQKDDESNPRFSQPVGSGVIAAFPLLSHC